MGDGVGGLVGLSVSCVAPPAIPIGGSEGIPRIIAVGDIVGGRLF